MAPFPMSRFIFRGNAVAAAGNFPEKADQALFPVLAATSLPIIGGESTVKINEILHKPYIGIGHAITKATGKPEDGVFMTQVSTDLAEVSLGDKEVTIEKTGIKLISKHRKRLRREIPISVEIPGFQLEARIQGHRLTVQFDPRLASITKPSQLQSLYRRDSEFQKMFDRHTLNKDLLEQQNPRYPRAVRMDGFLIYHLVKSIRWRGPSGVVTKDNWVRIPGYGTLFFGEVIRDSKSMRVNLLRVELEPSTDTAPSRYDKSGVSISQKAAPPERITSALLTDDRRRRSDDSDREERSDEDQDDTDEDKEEVVVGAVESNGHKFGP